MLRDVWSCHFRNELIVDRMRRDNKGLFNVHEAFQAIDSNNDGFLDKDDVSSFLPLKGSCVA